MTSTVLAVATLMKKSNIPQDAVQNTFVFGGLSTPPLATELDNLTTAITAFYNGTSPHLPIASLMSASLSTTANANTIDYYLLDGHLDGSHHGSPIRVDHWSLSAVDTTALPDEVAICLSYHRNYGADIEFGVGTRPRSRDRGRLFLGPWGNQAMSVDPTTKESLVSTGVIGYIIAAAHDLVANTPTTPWVQWSRSKADTALVAGGWVDNAFDTQRRRGERATVRNLWVA